MKTVGLLILIFVVFVSGAKIPQTESSEEQDELLVGPTKEPLVTSEEVHSDKGTANNGKDPFLNILPFVEVEEESKKPFNHFKEHQKSSDENGNGFYYYPQKEDERTPQVFNGFAQHQEASNVGLIGVKDGHFGFGNYNAAAASSTTPSPAREFLVRREPQVFNGFAQHQGASNLGGILIKDGHFGFGDYNQPAIINGQSSSSSTTTIAAFAG